MKQILLIICLSIFVVAVSQILGMTSARADLVAPPKTEVVKPANLVLRAVVDGNVVALKQQIALKADLDFKDDKGETALIKATADEKENLVKVLVKAKANVNLKDNAGNTALFYAVSNGSVALTKMLIQAKADLKLTYGEQSENLLFDAVRVDNAEIAKLLVKADKSLLNSLNKHQENPLFEAGRIGAFHATKYLISQGMSAKVKNAQGKTALEIAQENNLDATIAEMKKSK